MPTERESALRRGWTTGACATAATRAAYTALLTGAFPDPVSIALREGDQAQHPLPPLPELRIDRAQEPIGVPLAVLRGHLRSRVGPFDPSNKCARLVEEIDPRGPVPYDETTRNRDDARVALEDDASPNGVDPTRHSPAYTADGTLRGAVPGVTHDVEPLSTEVAVLRVDHDARYENRALTDRARHRQAPAALLGQDHVHHDAVGIENGPATEPLVEDEERVPSRERE